MIFDFLKYCLGNEVDMTELVAKMDWRQLYEFAKKQAIVGFCFEGIERLGNEYPEVLRQNPIGQDLLMEWMGEGATDSPKEHEGECGGWKFVFAVAKGWFEMLRLERARQCADVS